MSPTNRSFFPGDAFGKRGRDGVLTLDAPAASLLNDTLAMIRAAGVQAASAPMTASGGPTGRSLSIATPPATWGRLGGLGAPYSFTEQVFDPPSGWTMPAGARTGNAYEANGLTGLGGKVLRLTYEPTSGDWRFQYARTGSPSSCNVCAIVRSSCSGNPAITGATATLKQGSTTIGTATTSGVVTGLSMTAHGSGYKPWSSPATLTISGTGSGASGRINYSGGALTAIPVTAGGGGYAAPTILLSGGGGGSAASASAICTVTSGALLAGGSGYTDGSYTDGHFTGGGGTGATFSYTVVGGVVTSMAITAPGSNYTSAPTAVFTGGGTGTGAAGSGRLSVASISVTGGGSLYESPPSASVADAYGSGATLGTATISPITVGSLTLLAGGSGYGITGTTATISGGAGSGATAAATVTVEACFGPITAGSYTLMSSATGKTTATQSVTLPTSPPCTAPIATLNNATTTLSVVGVCGCNGGFLSGATVTVTQGGSTVATGTTDASGDAGPFTITANVSGTVTVHYGTPFADRVYSFGPDNGCGSGVVISQGVSYDLNLLPASGFVCVPGCNFPAPYTLTLTDPYGSCTCTYDGSSFWVGSHTVTWACGDCTTRPLTLTYSFGAVTGLSISNRVGTLPAGAPCPQDGGPNSSSCTTHFGTTAVSCPPSLVWTFTVTSAAGDCDGIYCLGGSATVMVTVTE